MRETTLTKDFLESVSYAGSGNNQPAAHAANILAPVLRITVPKSRYYTFRNLYPLILKLFTAGGAEISNTSRLLFAVKKPGSNTPQEIMGGVTYSAWGNTPLVPTIAGQKGQYDDDTKANRRIAFLPGADVRLAQDQMMELLVQSSVAVSMAHANSFFELKVIESDVETQVAV